MKKLFVAAAIALAASNAYAIEKCTENCSEQIIGDTSNSVDNSNSHSTQLNPSSNSNVSSGEINTDQRLQQSNNKLGDSNANSSSSGNRTDTNASNGDQSFTGNSGDITATTGNNNNDVSGNVSADIRSGDQSFAGSVGDSSASATTGNNTNEVHGSKQGQGQEQYADSNSESAANSDQEQTAESNVDIDNSDRSTSSYSNKVDARSLYIPAIATPVIPSTNPAANLTTIVGACGPMFSVNREHVHGAFVGLTRTKLIEVGHEDFKAPYVDANGVIVKYEAFQQPNGGWQILGHQAIYTIAVVNVSGSRQLGLGGGGGSAMNWAQGQAGGSSAMQRMITNIQVESCVAGGIEPPPAVRIANRIKQ